MGASATSSPDNGRPLRLAILWHQHQPYYKTDGEYLLPWTRLHGTKDYLEMATALERFPGIRATINVVPSLLLQLRDYTENGAVDSVLRLSRVPAADLNDDDKRYMLRQFFLCNVDRMVLPYPRYRELYRASQEVGAEPSQEGLERFTERDWRDLQVWYVLTWVGEYSRENEPFAGLLRKGSDFTEEEKHALLEASIGILAEVIPTYRRLAESGQVELSVTPFYHPILPLLCDSYSALEAMPNANLPERHIRWPEDAGSQIERGITFFRESLGHDPRGMWPSEGSVSTASLELIRAHGLQWAASDEEILRRTLGTAERPFSHCFPWRVGTPAGPIRMLFRDREMSDSIGFVYASWDPEDAAKDFVKKALDRRTKIIAEYGEAALGDAILPVILDGENCWEYYERNGRPFLEALYRELSNCEMLRTVTISEGIDEIPDRPSRALGRIASGSWIAGNFRIWIGHEEDNLAWDLLAEAREALVAARGHRAEEEIRRAYEEILMAQGSDWFWWYGDENTAANEDDFDRLFREHLRNVYTIIGQPSPDRLAEPIHRSDHAPSLTGSTGSISPSLTGRTDSSDEWAGAGCLPLKGHGGAMHRADITEACLLFGTDGTNLFLRYEPSGLPGPNDGVRIILKAERRVEVGCRQGQTFAYTDRSVRFSGISIVAGETVDIAINGSLLADEFSTAIEAAVELYDGSSVHERIPAEGTIELRT